MNRLAARHTGMKIFTFIVALCALSAAPGFAADKGPSDVLKHFNKQVEVLLRKTPAKDSPEAKKQQEDIKQNAAQLLDYSELAKRSLAQHWETLKPAQREEFNATFREMLEKNYVKQIKSNIDYQVQYLDESVTGDESRVKTIIKIKDKGKTLDAEIEYKMHKVGPNWMVFDIITDEVSLVRNYKTQFNKIIAEQGYDKLIEKMKSKLKESP
jgi:phospholipid transport system substrate-binding protein